MKPHIVLTRPVAQSRRFAADLSQALGEAAGITESPLLQINPLDFGPVSDASDVIFTSENGVVGFVAGAAVGARRAFCVGDRTAKAAREAGFAALSASGAAADLIELIAREGGGEMIYARGAHVARDLSADLTAIGIPVHEVLVYTQDPLKLSEMANALVRGAGRVIFPLFSARSMELLIAQGVEEGQAEMHAVCISKGVAQVAPEGCFDSVVVCDAPNSRSMIEKLLSLVA